MDNPETRL